MKKELPEREAEALMRLSMCAMRQCRICKYNKRKRVMVSIPERCIKVICDSLQVLVEAACVEVQDGKD